MCNATGQKISGAALYILGLLVAGVMLMVVGAEYNDDNTNNDDLGTYFWVYAIAMFVGAIGLVLENGDRFCGEEEIKNVEYFGGLFQVCAVFVWAALGWGLAHFYEDNQFWVGGAPPVVNLESATERASMAYMSGVAGIFYAFGSLFVLKKLLCCEGDFCDMTFILSLINMFLMILLCVCWFVFADKLEDEPGQEGKADDDRRTFSYLIGAVFLIMGVFGVLKILGVCFSGKSKDYGGDDKKDYGYDNENNYEEPRPQPSYNAEPQRPSYGAQPATAGY